MAPSKKDAKPTRKKDKSNGRRKKAEKRTIRPRRSGNIELYCVCRQPWDGNSLMVQCDQCQDWFHPKCVGVSRRDAKDNPFVCPQCQDKPILKLINYQMGSYSKKMQTSYYESLDPNRLYQLYSIPHIQSANAQHSHSQPKPSLFELNTICHRIMHQMTGTHHALYDMELYRQLIAFMTKKKNKIERIHCGTIHECNRYFLSCLFTKYCDLTYDLNKSKPYLISKLICDAQMKDLIHGDVISNIISKYGDENEEERKLKDALMRERMTQSMQLMDVCSIMCLNCNGQITTNAYVDHIRQCYSTKHVFYEQALQTQPVAPVPVSFDHDDLLFETKYKSKCVPPNPLEIDLNEESEFESDVLSVPDIFDRKKVLKHLIRNRNKNKCLPKRHWNAHNVCNLSNEMYHKIYCKLLPDEEEEEDDDEEEEEEEDDYDDDDDDDIPIAQNINRVKMDHSRSTSRGGGYNYNLRQRPCAPIKPKPPHLISKPPQPEVDNDPLKYKKMEHKFKRYYKENKIRKLKRKQKEYQMKLKLKNKNQNKDKYSKYNARVESDKIMINKLYSIITAIAKRNNLLSMHKSKQLLNKLMECSGPKLKLKHCGYLFDNIVSDAATNHEHNEQKTMRMELDEDVDVDVNVDVDVDTKVSAKDANENKKYLYFCHEKLNKNGLCSIHKNWRSQKYKQLLCKLKNEIEEIFLLKCTLKEMNNLWNNDKERDELMEKQRHCQLEQSLKNNAFATDDNDIASCITIKVDETQTNIDLLLQSEPCVNRDTLQNIEKNAVLFPNQPKII